MSSGIATQRRTGAPVVGEVLMDASIHSVSYSQMLVSHVMNRLTDLKHIRSSHPIPPASPYYNLHPSTPPPLVPLASRQFADGGTYSQKTLSESILEVEKIRKSFEAKKQAERVERALKEGELRAGDVDVLVKEFSLTPSQAKTCLIGSSGDLRAAVKSLFEGSVLPAAA